MSLQISLPRTKYDTLCLELFRDKIVKEQVDSMPIEVDIRLPIKLSYPFPKPVATLSYPACLPGLYLYQSIDPEYGQQLQSSF